MTYLPALLDFDQRTLVEARTVSPAQKLLSCVRAERTHPQTTAASTTTPAEAKSSEAKSEKTWTAHEIALATFWVAG
jgi:hypothetical protein